MEQELRQRRTPKGNDNTVYNSNGEEVRSTGESIDKTCTRVIITTVLLTLALFTTIYTVNANNGNAIKKILPSAAQDALEKLCSRVGLYGIGGRQYGVVIDAGSTGSRVLGFSFHRSIIDNSLQLDEELWKQVKPGLSFYHEQPENCSHGLIELLDEAKSFIPKDYWKTTPITLKATAGLRLLPKEEGDAILDVARTVLEKSGFLPEENLIEIMNPMEEGLYGWFTVNFLLGQFNNIKKSFVSLDLGGGSTQITFAPTSTVEGLEGRKHFMHNVNILQNPIQVYSHSYLGLGLMAAREAILLASSIQTEAVNNEEIKKVTTACMAHGTKSKDWSFHGNNYIISHTTGDSKENAFQSCLELVNNIINVQNVHTPSELKSRKIAAFSYFFDLAAEHYLVNDGATDAVVKISDFINIAKNACAFGGGEHRFACMDLTFISALLTTGYGLPPDKEIQLYKKINGHEASWALGLAYKLLDSK